MWDKYLTPVGDTRETHAVFVAMRTPLRGRSASAKGPPGDGTVKRTLSILSASVTVTCA